MENGGAPTAEEIKKMADLMQTAVGTGVENRMFFGMEDIAANMFRNKVRKDLLRRWIHFAGFPAPFLPRARGSAKGYGLMRVTTWGLVEAWLLTLTDDQFTTAMEEFLNKERGFGQKMRAIGLLNHLVRREKLDGTKEEIQTLSEAYIERRIRARVESFERWLREEIGESARSLRQKEPGLGE